MSFQWLLSPLALYGTLALALVGCLMFFVSLKRDLHLAGIQTREASAGARSDFDALAEEVRILRQALREIEYRPVSPVPAASLNLTKRAQALRMFRRGEPVHTIAAAVKAPHNEILLLLKIEGLVKRAQQCVSGPVE